MSDSSDRPIRWTIMLYIAADGTLANFAVESLKQLNNSISAPAGPNDEAMVVVAAQFSIDAPGGQQIPRYIFNECSGGSLTNSLAGYLNAPANMTEQQALISFLQWVYANKKCEADRYALILWGHGPELLLQPLLSNGRGDSGSDTPSGSGSLYLSPEELRIALEIGVPREKPLNIIAFDACSMSMFEMAFELREQAAYMVASQEEVPDPSFPYDTLVHLIRRLGGNEEKLLISGVQAYVTAYQDYICNAVTKTKRATLSALRLKHCGLLQKALCDLSCALLAAKDDHGLPVLLIEARGASRDFVGGLYVDLYDFSSELLNRLAARQTVTVLNPYADTEKGDCGPSGAQAKRFDAIQAACQDVIRGLSPYPGDSPERSLILANYGSDPRGHGLSVYFPYLSDDQYEEATEPPVKGGIGTLGGKDFSAVMSHAGSGLWMCTRRELIVNTEGYYEALAMAQDTAWYRFIVEQWSRILATIEPDELDLRYSAQQCAVNACRPQPTARCKCGKGKTP